MTVTAQLDLAILDAADIAAVGRFYATWITLADPAGHPCCLVSQRAGPGRVGPAAYGGPRAGPTSDSVAAPAPELNAPPADAA